MAGKYSKDKGYRAENELRHLFLDNHICCERVPLSGAVEFRDSKCDLILMDKLKVEVKIRKTLNNLLYEITENNDFGAVRSDRKDWLIVMKFDKFIELLQNQR